MGNLLQSIRCNPFPAIPCRSHHRSIPHHAVSLAHAAGAENLKDKEIKAVYRSVRYKSINAAKAIAVETPDTAPESEAAALKMESP